MTFNASTTNDFLFHDSDFASLNIADQLDNIQLPSLVLHGRYDLNVSIETDKRYFDLLGFNSKQFH